MSFQRFVRWDLESLSFQASLSVLEDAFHTVCMECPHLTLQTFGAVGWVAITERGFVKSLNWRILLCWRPHRPHLECVWPNFACQASVLFLPRFPYKRKKTLSNLVLGNMLKPCSFIIIPTPPKNVVWSFLIWVVEAITAIVLLIMQHEIEGA